MTALRRGKKESHMGRVATAKVVGQESAVVRLKVGKPTVQCEGGYEIEERKG